MTSLLSVVMMAAFFGVATPAQAVPIRFTYTDSSGEGFNDPTLGTARRTAFETAARIWEQRLPGTIPIVISASMDPLQGDGGSAVLGSAGPTTFFVNASGFPVPDVFYPVALGNQLAGVDLNQSQPEIVAQFNSNVDNDFVLGQRDFYYGLDGNPGSDIDFFSVVLHEFGHGLGFIDAVGQNGAFLFNGRPSIFDVFLATGPAAGSPRLTSLSQSARAAALISRNLFFVGPNAIAAGGGAGARIYAVNPFEPGSSIGHLDEDTYNGINELMTPISSGVAHDPGPIALAIFRDIGWATGGSTPPTPVPPGPTPTPTPPPATGPGNDNFANAQVINGTTGRVTGNNVNATRESGEPSHSPDSNQGGRSVWYRWTSPGSGKATFNTTGSNFDTLLAIYRGTAVNALTALPGGKNDDASNTDGGPSAITVDVVAGTTYNIAVDGFNAGQGADEGTLVLNWSLASTGVANDNLANAQLITGSSGRVTGSNTNATKETGEPNHAGNAGGKSVWYRWTSPITGRATFNTLGSNFNTLLAIYTGTAMSTLRVIASNDNAAGAITSSVTFNTVANTTYRIAVDGARVGTAVASGNIVLNWLAGPPNDNFANAQVLSGTSGRVNGTNVNATKETGEPSHSPDNNRGGKSVWYRWTAPSTGRFTFSTGGSNFDTVMAIYTGSSVSALTALPGGKNDDISQSVQASAVTLNAIAGTTYRIAVDGFNATTNPASAASGSIVLSWSVASSSVARTASGDSTAKSSAVLSLGAVKAATGTVRLRFSAPLEASGASDPAFYTVLVNGSLVQIESAAYAANSNSVVLALPEGTLRFGDAVVVRWSNLKDAVGCVLSGQTGTLIAR